MLDAYLLHGIVAVLLNMEAVNGYRGIREALLYYGMHTLGEVHRYLKHLSPLVPKDTHQCLYDILDLGSLDNGHDGSLAAMGSLVGDYCIKFTVRERCLVNAQMWPYVLVEDKPVLCMCQFFPGTVTAEEILVGTFELVSLDVIRFLE